MTPAHDDANHGQKARLEALLAMGGRLKNAVDDDILALENGDFSALKTSDPEIARLAAFYMREISAVKSAGGIQDAPEQVTTALKDTIKGLMDSLTRHEHLVAAMREASEGLVHAIAEEIESKRRRDATYSPVPRAKSAPSEAIICNKLV